MLGQLERAFADLERAFADKDASQEKLRRFVADASHELRTPLTSIRGYADLYLTGVATDVEATSKGMQRIRSEAVRTSELVNDLLLLANLDQGRTLATDQVDLSRIVTDSVADLRAVQPTRSIRHDVNPAVTVLGDEPRLRQAIANLLANTRTHAGNSNVEVQLTVDDQTARAGGRRPRSRDGTRRSRPGLRPVLASQQGPRPPHRRHRPRARHRRLRDSRPRRHHHRRHRPRPRHNLHDDPAARSPARRRRRGPNGPYLIGAYQPSARFLHRHG